MMKKERKRERERRSGFGVTCMQVQGFSVGGGVEGCWINLDLSVKGSWDYIVILF